MSTGRPPPPEVASITTRASPAGRSTGTITPVDVSLWAQATTSQVGSDVGAGAVPGSLEMITGSARKGASRVTVANFDENSPYVRWSARSRTRPKARASQNAVV